MFDRTAASLFLALLLRSIGVAALLFLTTIGLTPDEAQYWTWSQALDWGYYSKPPGIAWQIHLGTLFFGNSEWGVRAGSFFLSALLAFAIYRLAFEAFNDKKKSFLAAILFAFSPFGILSSFLAITDTGSILFFTLALLAATKTYPHVDALSVGAFIALGALFKWPIYFFWPILFFALYVTGRKVRRLIPGLLLSLCGLLPSLYWNIGHEFATFRHVLATLVGQHQRGEVGTMPTPSGNFLEFFGAQLLLVTPFIFFLMVAAAWKYFRDKDVKASFLSCFFIVPGTLALFFSFFQKLQGNWIDFIYPAGFVLAGSFAGLYPRLRRAFWFFSFLLIGVAFSWAPLQEAGLIPPSRFMPFKHAMGWNHLEKALQDAGYNPSSDKLLADTYQTASLLSFYGNEQKRAYFFNLKGIRHNQFSFWGDVSKGSNGYFVLIESSPFKMEQNAETLGRLSSYFEKVSFKKSAPLYAPQGVVIKRALIFSFKNYLGIPPSQPNKF